MGNIEPLTTEGPLATAYASDASESDAMVGTYAQAAGRLTRAQLLDLVLEIEDRLRILIRSVFARTRPDWTSLIPRVTREALESEGRSRRTASDPDLRQFATLKQLIDTMASKWSLFQSMLDDKNG